MLTDDSQRHRFHLPNEAEALAKILHYGIHSSVAYITDVYPQDGGSCILFITIVEVDDSGGT